MSNATRNLQPEEQGEVTVGEVRPFPAEEDLMELLNRGYVCPAEAGPAWRAAYVAGVDMGLIEDADADVSWRALTGTSARAEFGSRHGPSPFVV